MFSMRRFYPQFKVLAAGVLCISPCLFPLSVHICGCDCELVVLMSGFSKEETMDHLLFASIELKLMNCPPDPAGSTF